MIEFLYGIDKAVFLFLNRTLANPVGDALWPILTDYDKLLPVRIVLLCVWIALLWKGGVRGRTVALMLIPLLFLTDKFSSHILKEWVARPRPCHVVDGLPVIPGIHLLVGCGSGYSFPSSHAVNNFGVATMFASYYPRWKWCFLGWASLIALSRPIVGVHYPSDILGGAIIGTLLALGLVALWTALQKKFFPSLGMPVAKENA